MTCAGSGEPSLPLSPRQGSHARRLPFPSSSSRPERAATRVRKAGRKILPRARSLKRSSILQADGTTGGSAKNGKRGKRKGQTPGPKGAFFRKGRKSRILHPAKYGGCPGAVPRLRSRPPLLSGRFYSLPLPSQYLIKACVPLFSSPRSAKASYNLLAKASPGKASPIFSASSSTIFISLMKCLIKNPGE